MEPVQCPSDFAAAYARLRRIAGKLLAAERDGFTLSATDVVHEALGKLLAAGERLPNEEPAFIEFVNHAVRAMSEVLIDYSRRKSAIKRGGRVRKVRLDDLLDLEATLAEPDFDWASLEQALTQLKNIDPRRHQVITLRFFGGLDNRQIARELDLDERTVGRDWSAARLWLKDKLLDVA